MGGFIGVVVIHGVRDVLPDVRVAGRVRVVFGNGLLQVLRAHRVQRRGDGKLQHGAVHHNNVHEHGEPPVHAGGDGHLFRVRSVADGNEGAVLIKEAHFTDNEVAHTVINDDFHIHHVGDRGVLLGGHDGPPPQLPHKLRLFRAGQVVAAPAVTGGGLGDFQLGPRQNAVGDEGGPRRGYPGAVLSFLVRHFRFPPVRMDKFQGLHDTPEARLR